MPYGMQEVMENPKVIFKEVGIGIMEDEAWKGALAQEFIDHGPVRLCCGKRHWGIVCPDGFIMCQLCFDRFPKNKLFRDEEGYYHDICVECQIGENLAWIKRYKKNHVQI